MVTRETRLSYTPPFPSLPPNKRPTPGVPPFVQIGSIWRVNILLCANGFKFLYFWRCN